MASEESNYPRLSLVAEKSLPAKCKTHMVAYCPTMDLIALVSTADEELSVYRLNGQRVFGGSFGGDPYYLLDESDGDGEDRNVGKICGMKWKNNGRLFIFICFSRLHYSLMNGADYLFKAIFSRLLARMIPSGSSAPTVGKPSITTQHIAIYRNKMEKTTLGMVTATAKPLLLRQHHRSN